MIRIWYTGMEGRAKFITLISCVHKWFDSCRSEIPYILHCFSI